MLVTIVIVYLLITIAIGLYASRRVHDSKDFMVAGRSLPLYISVATVFATWFGAETVLSVSAIFALDGLNGIKPPIVERAIKRRDGPFSRARSAEGLSGRAGRAAISFEAAAIDLLHGGIIIDDQQAHRC